MALVSTSTYPSFSSLFDDFFNREMSDWRNNNYSSTQTTLPKVNIKEQKDAYLIEMAAPGMKKEDFNIALDSEVLTISSSKKEDSDTKRYTLKEFSYQSFKRSFALPESIDGENIAASYENGVLRVRIPKKELQPKGAKKIQIS